MISIALCTYNGERFLQDQLDSIARQTILPDELVVCDDCSGDRTIEILRSYKGRIPFPVHIHINEKNLGTVKNFEKAVQLCTGDIIVLCDQDDVWKPEKLKKILETFSEHPDAGYVFSDAEVVDESLKPYEYSLWESIGFTDSIINRYTSGDQFLCFTIRQFVTGATMAFRSKFKEFAIPYPTGREWIHDGWTALIFSAIGAYGVPIQEKLVLYRQHQSQQMGAAHPDQFNQSLWRQYKNLQENMVPFYKRWEERNDNFIFLYKRLDEIKKKFKLDSGVFQDNENVLEQLKIHFTNGRAIFSDKGLKRYKLILAELFSGRYKKFSFSWKSAMTDLILR